MALLFTLPVIGCGNDDDDSSGGVTPGEDDDTLDDDITDDDITDDDISDDDASVDDDSDDDVDDDVDDDLDDDTTDDDYEFYVERLWAGASAGYLDAPIGISMGGYGARLGPITPYNHMMGGSNGYHDRPNAKAVALHMHDTWLVILKASLPWPTETMRTMIVDMVEDSTGMNLDRTLIFSGTHTHSGPARYFAVPDITGLIGMDTYDQELTERMAVSLAECIIEAMDNAEPAKIGFGYRENFDPNYIYAHDRRCENGPGDFMENRLWVGYVESDEGDALAVLTGMAMHGTLFNTPVMTGDAPDGVERGLEALFDHPVPALYIQGSAGDASPAGGSPLGHPKQQNVQLRGYMIAQMAEEIIADMILDAEPELKVITKRYTHDRETLGYQPGEFGYVNPFNQEFVEFEIGALECAVFPNGQMGSIVDCDNPDTTLKDGYLGCLVNLGWPIFADHINTFRQSPITVAQIGDTYFYTTPGELTAHLAVDIREAIADALDIDFEQINSIGYGQNYLFYLTQDWDWWQGGFEVEGSLFGWRMGRWLTEEIPQLALLLNEDDPGPFDDPAPSFYYEDDAEVEPEISENLGVVETQPPAVASIFDTIQFAWHGGHPGVDMFTVTVQRLEGDGYVDCTHANGSLYDDKGWEMRLTLEETPKYRGTLDLDSRDFLYILDWETNWDDPNGTLRLKVEGTAKTAGGLEPYTVYSESFELQTVDSVELSDLSANVDENELIITVSAA
ncbi:MAG: hypothetical protein ACTSXZ_06930, partial [Alphaproteobacteria bacterium]